MTAPTLCDTTRDSSWPLLARAVGAVLTLFDFSRVMCVDGLITWQAASNRAWLVVGSLNDVRITSDFLLDRAPVVFVSSQACHADLECPLLSRRLYFLPIQSFVLDVVGLFRLGAIALPPPPKECTRPCIFDRRLAAAVKCVEHDRFGKFRTFGMGKRLFSGAGTSEDLAAMHSVLSRDVKQLRQAYVDCVYLHKRQLPYFDVLKLMEEALRIVQQAGVTLAITEAAIKLSLVLNKCDVLLRREVNNASAQNLHYR